LSGDYAGTLYKGWGLRGRLTIILICALLLAPVVYRLWTYDYFPWFVDGILISFVIFVIALVYDRPLRPWLGLHHVPELSFLFFTGSVLGVFIGWVSLAIAIMFPVAVFILLTSLKRLKSFPDPRMRVAGDVVTYTVTLWVGLVAGILLH
jgi:uncharacterized membrane protein YedE/YeeE